MVSHTCTFYSTLSHSYQDLLRRHMHDVYNFQYLGKEDLVMQDHAVFLIAFTAQTHKPLKKTNPS